jgi:hypothetical protein
MRHIIHQIFERYLNSRQPEFDTSIRELWPTERFTLNTPAAGAGHGSGVSADRGRKPAHKDS